MGAQEVGYLRRGDRGSFHTAWVDSRHSYREQSAASKKASGPLRFRFDCVMWLRGVVCCIEAGADTAVAATRAVERVESCSA